MRVLILAAGVGRRLGPLGIEQPKCLLPLGGKTLLARHLEILDVLDIDSVVIVVGYRDDMIRAELDTLSTRIRVSTVLNRDYTKGSIVSLWTLRENLVAGGDVLVMDADVLYGSDVLRRLVTTAKPNCFLLDRDFDPGEEPVKLCVHNGQLVEFRKQLAEDLNITFCGESVGFFRLSEAMARRLAQRCEEYVDNGRQDEPYEEAIRDLLLETPSEFGYEDITGLPWLEIDFPEDVVRASRDILSQIENIGLGSV